jgi:hypothetical protein
MTRSKNEPENPGIIKAIAASVPPRASIPNSGGVRTVYAAVFSVGVNTTINTISAKATIPHIPAGREGNTDPGRCTLR